MNLFDNLEATAFNTVARTMGYDAYWHPGGCPVDEPIKARVLFNNPSRREDVGNTDYPISRPYVEFKQGDWDGLKTEADSKETSLIEVNGVFYYVFSVIAQSGKSETSRDGDTFIATLEKAHDHELRVHRRRHRKKAK